MNLCFNSSKELFVSESNGVIKKFTTAGKYLSLVGIAKVPAGCKNSAVAVGETDGYVYYIDIQGSGIIVLEKQKQPKSEQSAQR